MNVASVLLPLGGYGAAIELDDDHAFTLDGRDAVDYANHAIQVAHRAEYDAAVLRQMLNLDGLAIEESAATQVLIDLREERPPLIEAGFPISYSPGVTTSTPQGRRRRTEVRSFCTLHLSGKPHSQLEPQALLQHALHVLEVPVVADLDVGYHRVLTSRIGLDAGRASAIVDDLGKWRSMS